MRSDVRATHNPPCASRSRSLITTSVRRYGKAARRVLSPRWSQIWAGVCADLTTGGRPVRAGPPPSLRSGMCGKLRRRCGRARRGVGWSERSRCRGLRVTSADGYGTSWPSTGRDGRGERGAGCRHPARARQAKATTGGRPQLRPAPLSFTALLNRAVTSRPSGGSRRWLVVASHAAEGAGRNTSLSGGIGERADGRGKQSTPPVPAGTVEARPSLAHWSDGCAGVGNVSAR